MPKVRKEIPELEKLVQVGRKKFFCYEEGAQRIYREFLWQNRKKRVIILSTK